MGAFGECVRIVRPRGGGVEEKHQKQKEESTRPHSHRPVEDAVTYEPGLRLAMLRRRHPGGASERPVNARSNAGIALGVECGRGRGPAPPKAFYRDAAAP
jgi:hypothetical protein